MKLLRVSKVASFFKGPDYMDYLESRPKRERTLALKRAIKVGTRVDQIIKCGVAPDEKDSEEMKSAYTAFLKFTENYPYTRSCAVRLANTDLGITGEPDLYFDGREISDIKCSSEIRLEYWIQLGGYLWLPNPIKPDRVSILRLDKRKGEYEYRVRKDLSDLRMLFVGELNKVREYLKENPHYDDPDLTYEVPDSELGELGALGSQIGNEPVL